MRLSKMVALALAVSFGAAAACTRPPSAAPVHSSGGPTYAGCAIFPPGDPAYNQDISRAPIDADSAAYVASLGPADAWDDDRIEYVNVSAGGSTVPVLPKVAWHAMPAQPWDPSFKIETVADAHSFVLDRRACHLYELYQTSYDGRLAAYSGGDWDLHQPFVPHPPGRSSAVASGLSMFAGAVKYAEFAQGIRHALFLIVPYHALAQWRFVKPASSTDGIAYEGPGAVQLPYGAKLRLRADYPTAGLGPQAGAVVNALKTYGAIVGDTGCCYKFVYMNDPQTDNAFDVADLAALHAIRPVDFQVVALPKAETVPGH